MDHNILSVLKTGTLQNFQSLEKVYLRNCHVQTLNPGAFRNLPVLKELYLTTNVIDKLQSDAFQNVSALSLLNLAANRLTSVPDLSTLTGLSQLVMEANRIQNGTFPNGFASLHSLSTVVLSNNNLTELTNETFATLANCSIRRLEISRCNIKTVATGALTILRLLQSLKIGNNPIDGTQLQNMLLGLSEDLNLVSLDIRQINLGGVLPSGSFSILAKTPIATLIFRNNEIGSITARAFAHLPKLVMLDLGYCKIQNVDPQAFADLPALQRLFLYNNLLMTVPTNLPQSLTNLYLQFNMLGALKSGDFVNLGKLQELYLSNNKINEVSEDSFQGLVNLQILHLQHNLLSYIPKKLFSYTSRLRILFLRFNNIQNLKPNPGALSSLTSLVTLDMSHNECSYIPFDYFADLVSLETLYLDFNRLSGLMAGDTGGQLLSKLGSLKRLGLMSNDIYQIHDAQFRNLVSLDTLNLKNNRLSSWGSGLFHTPGSLTRTLQTVDLSSNQIALVNETSVRDLQNVKMLNLSLNPFACTCDLRWFRSWLNNTMVTVANKTTYTCNSPPEWANKLLLTFGADKINCIDYTWYYVGGAIGATLLIALVVCYVIYRHRWFIFLRLYRLRKALGRCCCGGDSAPKRAGYEQIPGVDVEETPRYEFYVIAASEDNDWVEQKLLPKLDSGPVVGNEGERYGGRFRLYYEPRDEKDGRTHVGNFDENMPLCRAALVVLSRDLVRDDWCRFLIDQSYQLKAENRLKEVRIIKKDQDILPRHIPRLMHRAMEKREFTDWIETTEHLEDSLGLGRILTDDDQGQSDSLAQEQEQAHLERGIN